MHVLGMRRRDLSLVALDLVMIAKAAACRDTTAR
jgi:hypothetical protein